VLILEPQVFEDFRGHRFESYNRHVFKRSRSICDAARQPSVIGCWRRFRSGVRRSLWIRPGFVRFLGLERARLDMRTRELAERVAEVADWEGRFDYDRSKPDDRPRKVLARLRALGWTAKMPLKEGFRKAYDRYVAHAA
jgi:hypothetical protein